MGVFVKGELTPDTAMKALTIFEGKFTRLKEERDNVTKAKEALELSEPGKNFICKCVKYRDINHWNRGLSWP